ncbi:uncharacterized protein L201_001715 [Kwoniella dendrophila CBS 6074]|uniref:Uncharacterized protein n=1 Tax=Kwoniella dendrophila CBS 6074 TaxID=1295534 RepID=A0AAX4JN46_9TREE
MFGNNSIPKNSTEVVFQWRDSDSGKESIDERPKSKRTITAYAPVNTPPTEPSPKMMQWVNQRIRDISDDDETSYQASRSSSNAPSVPSIPSDTVSDDATSTNADSDAGRGIEFSSMEQGNSDAISDEGPVTPTTSDSTSNIINTSSNESTTTGWQEVPFTVTRYPTTQR